MIIAAREFARSDEMIEQSGDFGSWHGTDQLGRYGDVR